MGVVRTQVRLQKLDFWLRNPDYLADELLTKYEVSAEARLLELAGLILDSEEPEVRRYVTSSAIGLVQQSQKARLQKLVDSARLSGGAGTGHAVPPTEPSSRGGLVGGPENGTARSDRKRPRDRRGLVIDWLAQPFLDSRLRTELAPLSRWAPSDPAQN